MKPILGTTAAGPLAIDVERLVSTRMLLTANSGQEATAARLWFTCETCRAAFWRYRSDLKRPDHAPRFCSASCRQKTPEERLAARRQRDEAWRDRNREHVRDYGRRYAGDPGRKAKKAQGYQRRRASAPPRSPRPLLDPTVKRERKLRTAAAYRERNRERPREIPAPVRRAVLERDGHLCRKCASANNLQLHHILAFQDGGEHTAENLITLCSRCHAEWTWIAEYTFDFATWIDWPPAFSFLLVLQLIDGDPELAGVSIRRVFQEHHEMLDRRRTAAKVRRRA